MIMWRCARTNDDLCLTNNADVDILVTMIKRADVHVDMQNGFF